MTKPETNAATVPTRSRVSRIGHILASLLLVLFVIGCVAFGVTMRAGHLQLEPVLSGSMRPVADPGDLIVAKETATSALRVGDVVAFFPPGSSSGAPVMHRIVTLSRDGGVTTITTKGDANRAPDAWGPIALRSTSTFRMVRVIPRVGFASVWFDRVTGNTGRGVLLTLAGVLVLALGATSLRRGRSPPVSGDAGAQTTTSVVVN